MRTRTATTTTRPAAGCSASRRASTSRKAGRRSGFGAFSEALGWRAWPTATSPIRAYKPGLLKRPGDGSRPRAFSRTRTRGMPIYGFPSVPFTRIRKPINFDTFYPTFIFPMTDLLRN